jgi:phospholipid/cholesterol/gamma-HCH transport system permease protein
LVTSLKNGFAEAGNATLFIARFFKEAVKPPYEIKEFIR